MKFVPVEDKILVKPDAKEEKSPGGIIIPDTAKQESTRGKVLGVGPGRIMGESGNREPMPVSEGDTVIFGKYSGNKFRDQGQEYVVLTLKEVLVKVVDE